MNLIPWLAFLAALAAFLVGALGLAGKLQNHEALQRRLLWGATALAGITLLVLLWLFVAIDVSFEYVFLYTSTDVPLRYRIAGVWAGREGSLALWAFWTIAVAAWASRTWKGRASQWTLVIMTGLAATFLGAVAAQDTFASTSDFFLQQRPGGNGLNPSLQSDFFLIHPPMMFFAYALTHVPASAAIAHLITGNEKWSTVSSHLARWNWLWYTAAMGLGGVWAYYTLGFGGYWAWDPVEVANLLPWLALTLYLHAQLHHRIHGRYPTIGPFLAILPFILTLFSTISTRSGLWVSVHAFTDPTQTFNPDAVGRFQDILAVESTLAFYVGLLLTTYFLFLALWARRLASGSLQTPMRIVAALLGAVAAWSALSPVTAYAAGAALANSLPGGTATGMLVLLLAATLAACLPAFLKTEEGKIRLDLQGINYAAVLILGLGLLILWLWHMVAANGWTTEFYEVRLPFLAAPAILALTVFMAMPHGKRTALGLALASLVMGFVLSIWNPAWAFLAMSLLFLALAIERTRLAATRSMPTKATLGRGLLAAGALANVLFWINPPSTILSLWVVQWPIQLLAIPSAIGLHRSFRHLAGQADGLKRTQWMVAILGGFYVAPLLALASNRLETTPVETRFQAARMKQIGLYLVHMALALAFVGYGTSTYLGDEAEATLRPDEAATLFGDEFTLIGTATAGAPVQQYEPVIDTADGRLTGLLRWEPTTGSYYPEPGTLRTWTGDWYVSVDRLCTGSCSNFETVTAYEPTLQRGATDVQEVDITLHKLPGLGLVWAALALFVQGMWMLTHSGISLSTGNSRETT